jgi:hypothetical protein
MCEEILYTALVAGLGSLRPFGETSALHAGEVRRMEMKKEQVGDAHVVTVVGRLDGIYGSAFANQVGELITGTNPKILIDFTDIDYVSSAGLRRSCCS